MNQEVNQEINQEYIGIVEIGETLFTIVKQGDRLIAGTCCNVGFIPHHEFIIEDFFSLDENLQSLVEELEEIEQNSI